MTSQGFYQSNRYLSQFMQMTKSPNKLIHWSGYCCNIRGRCSQRSNWKITLMPAEKSIGRPAIPFVGGHRLSHVMREAVKSSLWWKLMALRYCHKGAFSMFRWLSPMLSWLGRMILRWNDFDFKEILGWVG